MTPYRTPYVPAAQRKYWHLRHGWRTMIAISILGAIIGAPLGFALSQEIWNRTAPLYLHVIATFLGACTTWGLQSIRHGVPS